MKNRAFQSVLHASHQATHILYGGRKKPILFLEGNLLPRIYFIEGTTERKINLRLKTIN